jgi:gluconolactonase
VEKVQGGFEFTEGPLWFGGRLLFADIPADVIFQLVPPGTATRYRFPSHNANGLAVDPQGRLVASENGTHRLTRSFADGQVETIAAKYEGKSFNGPNDVIVRRDGAIYFTDPDGEADANDRQPFQGVFRLDPGGSLALVARDMKEPNGIALSPDETTLYVVDWGLNRVDRLALNADGTAGAPTPLVTTAVWPDGMAVDDAGDLYVATKAGVQVFRPEGTSRGTIEVPEQPSNCAFGGADRRTLYITARTSVYRVSLDVPGPP